jgi:hypothetical protein
MIGMSLCENMWMPYHRVRAHRGSDIQHGISAVWWPMSTGPSNTEVYLGTLRMAGIQTVCGNHTLQSPYVLLLQSYRPALLCHFCGLAGKLRLLYEAAPMAFLVEQAGGLALTGRNRILTLKPKSTHQRVPCILGKFLFFTSCALPCK